MTLIKDLIAIPERVHQGDFVLKLADGLAHARETVRDYVVTPQLATCFGDALSFVESAVSAGASKAAYLHGSFGSGKSHFMAVLNLLLSGDLNARSIPELAGAVIKLDRWVQGKRFLMVPYHMIGAYDLESAILGQYADHIHRLHPDAPVPGFYLSESLFDDARSMRTRLGDAAFFEALGAWESGHGWGDVDGGVWDATGFEAAMLEPATGKERQRLIGSLVRVFFPSYARVSASHGGGFVPLDEGLAIMSQHARMLGYDAVILFLDELILWLATHAADVNFVSREGSKLSKLVEAIHAERPVPLVSFIARQRDLRELVGHNLAGAIQLQFADVLKHWEARFHRITLEDRNLPVIAQRRILKPVSETARQTLDNAFGAFLKGRREVLDTLLGSTGEEEMFRRVYPFSPALVQALIAVSSVLQRERTALKLMLQLLVDRREELALGQIIPVGDLFDVIADGDEPFSDAMRYHFENAKKLYRTKLLPLLERTHGITWTAGVSPACGQDARGPTLASGQDARGPALRNDARLLKTLLLAALVPEVEALKALTGPRLAALNHGSVRSPIPGRETHMVLSKLRGWGTEVGEIKITEDNNPIISIQITGVDTDPILASVASEDNPGNRRRLVRTMLFEMLGLPVNDDLFQNMVDYEFVWRGTRRQVNVAYENVRELSDQKLRNQDGAWSVIIDFPFDDDPNRGPRDDIARIQEFQARHDGRADTIIWLPSHLSGKAARDLGTLARLNYVLTGEQRFADHARHLSAIDRDQARALLTNQRSQLQQRMRAYLEVAYGIADEPRDAVDRTLDGSEHLRSLNGFKPAMPVGATIKAAFDKLLDQLFGYQFPAHPLFDGEVKLTILRKVLPEIQKALADPDGRVFIADKAVRQLVRSIANPLKLGEMGETHFVISHHWRSHFTQRHGQQGGTMTVKRLRAWTDEPQRMGLPREVQNLVILVFAEQTNRTFVKGTAMVRPTLDSLDDELELREQILPPEAEWREAVRRSASLFGLTPAEVRNAGNVAKLTDTLTEKVSERRPHVEVLVRELERKLHAYGVETTTANRLVTARAALTMLTAITAAPSTALIAAFVAAPIQTSDSAMGQAMAKAKELEEALRDSAWSVFEVLRSLNDHRKDAAGVILARVVEILASDEHAIALKPARDEQHVKALRLLSDVPKPTPAPTPVPTPTPTADPAEIVIASKEQRNLSATDARRVLSSLDREMSAHPDYRLNLAWKIVRKGQET